MEIPLADLTEKEILLCLKENLRLAAEGCDKLASGDRGTVYIEFRAQMKLIEGCCRQMSGWREDTRWLPFGLKVAEAQQKCGRWIRERQPGWRFKGLGEILRNAYVQALELETKRTGRSGIILPKPAPLIRDSRPVSQIILPPGYNTTH